MKNEKQLMTLVQDTLGRDAYWQVNKKIARATSIPSAILIADLISKEKYFSDRDKLTPDGFFFNEQKNIEEDTGFSEYEQRKYIKELQEHGLLEIKYSGTPPRKFFKINHNQMLKILTFESENFSRIYNNNKLNKDSKESNNDFQSSPKKELISKKENPLIKYWNELGGVRVHKDPNKQIYIKAVKYIKQLRAGTFFHDNEFDLTRLSKAEKFNGTKKYSDIEIQHGFQSLANLFRDGYWPENKNILPKDLANLIFNPRTGYSFFLKVVSHTPRQIRDEIKSTPIDSDCYNKYRALFPESGNSARTENILILNFNSLYKEIKALMHGVGKYYSHTSFTTHFGTEKNLKPIINKHIKYLESLKQNVGALHIKTMTIDSPTWKKFVSVMEKEHGYVLYPDEKKLKEIKRDYERAINRQK